jgi:hypothetical protein
MIRCSGVLSNAVVGGKVRGVATNLNSVVTHYFELCNESFPMRRIF